MRDRETQLTAQFVQIPQLLNQMKVKAVQEEIGTNAARESRLKRTYKKLFPQYSTSVCPSFIPKSEQEGSWRGFAMQDSISQHFVLYETKHVMRH